MTASSHKFQVTPQPASVGAVVLFARVPLLVFCDVSLKEHNRDYPLRFEREVADVPEVIECHHIAGAYDYLLKIVVRDMDDYQRFVKEKLTALENIGRVQSHFVMTEVKNSTVLPVGGDVG